MCHKTSPVSNHSAFHCIFRYIQTAGKQFPIFDSSLSPFSCCWSTVFHFFVALFMVAFGFVSALSYVTPLDLKQTRYSIMSRFVVVFFFVMIGLFIHLPSPLLSPDPTTVSRCGRLRLFPFSALATADNKSTATELSNCGVKSIQNCK